MPTGGFTFAEFPDRAAPEARILWRADRDPETISVIAEACGNMDPDGIDFAILEPWLTVVSNSAVEHAVLTDGWHRIRLDVVQGSLATRQPVRLHYQIHGTISAESKLLPLRRLIHLYRHKVFTPALYPPGPSMGYAIAVLRVHDAMTAGVSQKEIARSIFGADLVAAEWNSNSDFLRSRTRRLVANARRMMRGGFKSLLRK